MLASLIYYVSKTKEKSCQWFGIKRNASFLCKCQDDSLKSKHFTNIFQTSCIEIHKTKIFFSVCITHFSFFMCRAKKISTLSFSDKETVWCIIIYHNAYKSRNTKIFLNKLRNSQLFVYKIIINLFISIWYLFFPHNFVVKSFYRHEIIN